MAKNTPNAGETTTTTASEVTVPVVTLPQTGEGTVTTDSTTTVPLTGELEQKASIIPVEEGTAPNETEQTIAMARRPGRPPGEISMNEVELISVTAYQESFRRAGRAFGRAPVEIHVNDINEADLKTLIDEPMLSVLFIAAKE